ncbi:uncharacterized protein LOC111259123 [Varroa jacobsoni]|uniref:uncharacterized protein LOC111259123 n=1 Tax=Varroa jacobsoni TaxID=62625 RepID=UPI000BF94ECE|nr:uncharacterized protein LOC111259123 [Varroa jacobsoni]XP_022686589.1 uncharacterized protein LOC111259123 [Varroa jacobsoni]XP_022686590.1 uncharacterized protein LOC111259123 [Varroa jacobsoni]
MNLLPHVLCSSLLILPALIHLSESTHHVEGVKHVIALKVVHKKMKKYLPKLIKSIHAVPVPVPLYVAVPDKKGFILHTTRLPDHLPPESPCQYAHYWRPKDLYGTGCDHHFGW